MQTQPDLTEAAFERRFDQRQIPQRERKRFYDALRRAGEGALLPEDSLAPVPELPALDELPEAAEPLSDLVVIKLNGGLGTTMGLSRAKGTLEVKRGLSYIDIASRQILAMRRKLGARLPLLLMNSFYTSESTAESLAPYPELPLPALPMELLQSQIPKVDAQTNAPVEWAEDHHLEWCPPGHGEIYFRLDESGVLKALLEAGFRWAFVSNIDNLGAQVDPRILAYCKAQNLEFLMEATPRTPADRKGGHLALRPADGRLILRERAQCPPGEIEQFENIEKHRFFNTNNLWVNLERLEGALAELRLPVIVNRKTVDPTRSDSTRVIQLESAMGAAIECFERAGALSVPRQRFVPTKNLEDLLLLRSDLFELGDDYEVNFVGQRSPKITLDPEFYGTLKQFEERFVSVPSLLECASLKVSGDVRWEGDPARVVGEVTVTAEQPHTLTSPGRLEGKLTLP